MKKILALTFAMLTVVVACRQEPDLANVPTVHFGTDIQLIISANCSMSGCHDGNSEFSLNGYDNVKAEVKAGDAHKSKLYRTVTGRDKMMPPESNPPLTTKQIQQLYVWIEQGALNN